MPSLNSIAVEVNGWQADKAFKEQIERKGGMPYKPGPNHPWKRFIVNYKYKPRELGKAVFKEKNVPDDCIRSVLVTWQTLMFLIHI